MCRRSERARKQPGMSPRGREKFPKTARLRKRPEFLKLSRAGRKQPSANFIVISRPNNRGQCRLGITVSGKVGNSVTRNRIKRFVREVFRRRRCELTSSHDFLVIAKGGAAEISAKSAFAELELALKYAGRPRNA